MMRIGVMMKKRNFIIIAVIIIAVFVAVIAARTSLMRLKTTTTVLSDDGDIGVVCEFQFSDSWTAFMDGRHTLYSYDTSEFFLYGVDVIPYESADQLRQTFMNTAGADWRLCDVPEAFSDIARCFDDVIYGAYEDTRILRMYKFIEDASYVTVLEFDYSQDDQILEEIYLEIKAISKSFKVNKTVLID